MNSYCTQRRVNKICLSLHVRYLTVDFITYLVTNFFFIKSNIGDPTLEI